MEDGTVEGLRYDDTSCPHVFRVYPTQAEYDKYVTPMPIIISLSISAIFAFAIGMFLLYDRLVERRQRIVLAKATQSTAIISSLFVSPDKKIGDCCHGTHLVTPLTFLSSRVFVAKASQRSFACAGGRQ